MAIRGISEVIFRGNGTESTVTMCVIALDSNKITSVAASKLPKYRPCSMRLILGVVFLLVCRVAERVETSETGSILSRKSLLRAFRRRSNASTSPYPRLLPEDKYKDTIYIYFFFYREIHCCIVSIQRAITVTLHLLLSKV